MVDRLPNGQSFVCVIDTEGTGTRADLGTLGGRHSLLEVGGVLCRDDAELTQVAEFEILIRPPGSKPDHDMLWSQLGQRVRDMHGESGSGLWAAATDPDGHAVPAHIADAQLSAFIAGQVGDAQVAFAGSGVSHHDDEWLRVQLPRLRGLMTYWSLDAGVFRRMLQYARRDDLVDLVGDVDAKPHRALGDAVLHACELRRYLHLLRSVPEGVEGVGAIQP